VSRKKNAIRKIDIKKDADAEKDGRRMKELVMQ
jgi:hypothetical protein